MSIFSTLAEGDSNGVIGISGVGDSMTGLDALGEGMEPFMTGIFARLATLSALLSATVVVLVEQSGVVSG